MKKVLMVAFHFPPLAGSSGIQRTLRFVQHLPQFGWQPMVLTAHPRAYPATRADLNHDIPPNVPVVRAQAFDCARHFSFMGAYPAAWARPDRWASWRFDAERAGGALIRAEKPDVIWSTFPIASAHVIAARLAKRYGLPWVADFRDPMAQDDYPSDPQTWRQWAAIEQHTLTHATRCTFVTPGAAAQYRSRYPALSAGKLSVIENGFDEASFHPAPPDLPLTPGRLTVLHSGVVYPSERDPRALLAALAHLLAHGQLNDIDFVFRAPGNPVWLEGLIRDYGLEHTVRCAPAIAYREALAEMRRADALLVLQASNCNTQIPAKLYEYLRANRPIIALTDPRGDTADLMRRSIGPGALIADLADAPTIARTLAHAIDAIRRGQAALPDSAFVSQSCRLHRSAELAALLNETCQGAPT